MPLRRNIAGWLADELHYTLEYDPSCRMEGTIRLLVWCRSYRLSWRAQLERDELGGLYFDPTKGAPETSGHRHQPVGVLCGAAHSQIVVGESCKN